MEGDGIVARRDEVAADGGDEAGDFRAHSGNPSEVFDNARRDVAATLVGLGFRPEAMTQFSTRPERYADTYYDNAWLSEHGLRPGADVQCATHLRRQIAHQLQAH